MDKEAFRQTQNQNVKTDWDDAINYLSKSPETSHESEKRERSFEKISEYTSKYFERNQDGSYNFLGIKPNEEFSDGVKSVIVNKLYSNYRSTYVQDYDEKADKKRKFISDNLENILRGEVLDKVDFSRFDEEVLIKEYNIDG